MGSTEQPIVLGFPFGPRDSAVRLLCDPAVPGDRTLAPTLDGEWRISLPPPPVDRFEYHFEVTRGHRLLTVLDPTNATVIDTPAGHRSVWRAPGYRPPAWMLVDVAPGRYEPMSVATVPTAGSVGVTVWSPAGLGAGESAGLLLVLDGPDYDRYASLTRLCAHLVAEGRVPPVRVALLTATGREDSYAGSHEFLRRLTGPVLQRLDARYPRSGPVAVLGASLGGLTAVLAALTDPRIRGVVAQSGSFFHPSTDPPERRFRHFDRIAAHVEAIGAMPRTRVPLVVGMTCGEHEENAANNRRMAAALQRAGHRVVHHEVPDLHTFTGWRDALEPVLTDVLSATW
ncbi:MAG: alpha/beta hydrolase-fold protein [Dermatophilaceae bacterium]